MGDDVKFGDLCITKLRISYLTDVRIFDSLEEDVIEYSVGINEVSEHANIVLVLEICLGYLGPVELAWWMVFTGRYFGAVKATPPLLMDWYSESPEVRTMWMSFLSLPLE